MSKANKNKKVLASKATSTTNLTVEQKKQLAHEVAQYTCIWRTDDEQFQRPQASERAFNAIAANMSLTVEACRSGWHSLKNALAYQSKTKPKKKKLKSGESMDFSVTDEPTDFDDERVLEAWEFYDCMKFFVEQKSFRKWKTTDSILRTDTAGQSGSPEHELVLVVDGTQSFTEDEVSEFSYSEAESPVTTEVQEVVRIAEKNLGQPSKPRNYSGSSYNYAWREEKANDKELTKGLMSSLQELVQARKVEVNGSQPSVDSNAMKYCSMFTNLDRMLQKLPEHTVGRLNLKFQQLIFDELDKLENHSDKTKD